MRFSSVFVGGGTPNVVSERFYIALFERLTPYLQPNCELTIELNPNRITTSFVATIRSLGFNRISLGAQSFNPQKLKWLMRNHDPQSIFKACEILVRFGFENLNADVIYNTPFDSPSNLVFETQNLAKLPLSHISAYALSIDEGSVFFCKNRKSTEGEEMCALLQELGFMQYEVSNYAKNDKYCRHNLGYWQHANYLGIGAGAVSFVGKTRSTNASKIEDYLKNPLQQNIEILSESELQFEQLFLGLRCFCGIPQELCHPQNLQIAIDEKLVRCKNGHVFANNYFLADEIALFLDKNQ